MDLVESKLRELYQALPDHERVALQRYGTIAVGMVSKNGVPRLVYTTNSNDASPAFQRAATSVGLERWVGDSGATSNQLYGPARLVHQAIGTGGINHAEQLMITHARDYRWVLWGMGVSRRLCNDCPAIVSGYRGGRLMISVIADDMLFLPLPRNDPRGTPTYDRTGFARRGDPIGGLSDPAANYRARSSTTGALVVMLNSALFGRLQANEQSRAQQALATLAGEIETLRDAGYTVVVGVWWEVPKTQDVLKPVTKVYDAGDVIRFNAARILDAVHYERKVATDRKQIHQGFVGRSTRPLATPKPGYRLEKEEHKFWARQVHDDRPKAFVPADAKIDRVRGSLAGPSRRPGGSGLSRDIAESIALGRTVLIAGNQLALLDKRSRRAWSGVADKVGPNIITASRRFTGRFLYSPPTGGGLPHDLSANFLLEGDVLREGHVGRDGASGVQWEAQVTWRRADN